jgi:small nuclear ribonucleoprotein (snRNP)-like protein
MIMKVVIIVADDDHHTEVVVRVQIPKTGKGKKASQPVNRDRFVSKMFLRGDSVVMILRNPK